MYGNGELSAALFVIVIFVMFLVFTMWLYKPKRKDKALEDVEVKMYLLEEEAVSMVAKKKGIDLARLAFQKKMEKGRAFQKRLEQEMVKEFFGNEEPKK